MDFRRVSINPEQPHDFLKAYCQPCQTVCSLGDLGPTPGPVSLDNDAIVSMSELMSSEAWAISSVADAMRSTRNSSPSVSSTIQERVAPACCDGSAPEDALVLAQSMNTAVFAVSCCMPSTIPAISAVELAAPHYGTDSISMAQFP